MVEAIQSMGAIGTGAEAIRAHLCLGHSQSFAQYFHKLKNNILGNADETVKNMLLKKLLMKKKMTIGDLSYTDEIISLTLLYGKK